MEIPNTPNATTPKAETTLDSYSFDNVADNTAQETLSPERPPRRKTFKKAKGKTDIKPNNVFMEEFHKIMMASQ